MVSLLVFFIIYNSFIVYSWTSLCRSDWDPKKYFDIGMVRDNQKDIMGSKTFWQNISFKKECIPLSIFLPIKLTSFIREYNIKRYTTSINKIFKVCYRFLCRNILRIYIVLCYDNSVTTIRYIMYSMKITFWQFTIFLCYDNSVMTIWNMLIVVCNQSTKSQLTWSRTDDYCLKTFGFIPNAILIKLITQIMAWLFYQFMIV